MTARGDCRWCVRVICQHTVGRIGNVIFPCDWTGVRPKAGAHNPCPRCGTTVGPFKIKAVSHRLSKVCVYRPRPIQ